MRTTSPFLVFLALILVPGCGGEGSAAERAAGAQAGDLGQASGTTPAAPRPKGKGKKKAQAAAAQEAAAAGKSLPDPGAPADAAEGPIGGARAVVPPLTGEAALAALRANVAATAARGEHTDPVVEVTHILVAFEGAERSRVEDRTREQAEQRAAELLARVVAGEDFEAVRAPNTDDPGPPTYTMALGQSPNAYPRGGMAKAFGDVGWRLEVGEVGVAAHDVKASPFGWHVIKRVK